MANASAREKAYQNIRNRIIYLDLKPGELINDQNLAEQMEMSRTPVREAILMLSLDKLVVVRPQSGTFVAPIHLEEAEMEQFARYALEKEVIQRLCRLKRPDISRFYEENLQLYQFYMQSRAPGRSERLLEVDDDFHRIAFQIVNMEQHFRRMLRTLQHIARYRILSLQLMGDTEVYQDHQKIVESIVHHDPIEAGRYLEEHMNRYQDHWKIIRESFPQYF